MRQFALLLALFVLLAVASTASAAAAAKKCGNLSAEVGAIKAKNVNCARARKVVKKHSTGTEEPFGYTCSDKPYEGGVTFRCRKGDKRVIYSRAD